MREEIGGEWFDEVELLGLSLKELGKIGERGEREEMRRKGRRICNVL